MGKKTLDLSKYKTIITSIPFSIDGEKIYSPYCNKSIYIDDLIKGIPHDAKVFGGPFNLEDNRFIDITKDPAFAKKCLIPTSEEVVKLVIEKWDNTIFHSKIWVIGNGNLKTRLEKLFTSLGGEIRENPKDSDIVINCEHSQKILKGNLKNIKKNSLIIDLSSKEDMINKRIVKARSLAIKSAPVFMAKAVYETLIEKDIIKL